MPYIVVNENGEVVGLTNDPIEKPNVYYVTKKQMSKIRIQYAFRTSNESITIIPGTILTTTQLTNLNSIKDRIINIVQMAKNLNGIAFSSLTLTQFKDLIALLIASEGWIDINGNIDFSDLSIEDFLK